MARRIPGLPALAVPAAIAAVEFLLDDSFAVSFAAGATQWGVFLDGELALPLNSVLSFEYRQDWTIADYQVEQGAFQSYDKVQLPFDVRVRVTSGSSISDRQALLTAVLQVGNSLDLFDVLTPEQLFESVSCAHVDFVRRPQNGLGMLIMDLWFQEIRETDSTQFSNTQQPADAGGQNIGTVQPQAPSSSFTPFLANIR